MATLPIKYNAKYRDFLFSWTGNKDREIGTIMDALQANGIDLANIDTVVEGFGGSFALIRYLIRNNTPGKRYIVHDFDTDLIASYNAMKEEKTNAVVCEELKAITPTLTKKIYADSIKSGIAGYILKHSVYAIRPGLFPVPVEGKAAKAPDYARMAAFTRYKDVDFIPGDFFPQLEKYKNNPRALVFLDPPYFLSSNDFYAAGLTDAIFTLIKNSGAYKCKILFVINDHILTRFFIETLQIPFISTEVHYSRSKKDANHIYFCNAPQLAPPTIPDVTPAAIN